jgi:hypothetical protein
LAMTAACCLAGGDCQSLTGSAVSVLCVVVAGVGVILNRRGTLRWTGNILRGYFEESTAQDNVLVALHPMQEQLT